MAYTFGGATTDLVSMPTLTAMSDDNRVTLFCGWFRPTTLTAGRYLASLGTAGSGVRIHTTTDELSLMINRATTDSEYVTTGADLVVDEWRFLAILCSNENTGALDAWRVWVGTLVSPPTEVTVSVNVSGNGNAVGSTTLTLGNDAGGSVAYQGDIDDVRFAVTSGAVGVLHPFLIGTSGAISQAEADYTLERYIYPAWMGASWELVRRSPLVLQLGWWSGLPDAQLLRAVVGSASEPAAAVTYTGATPSAMRAPRVTTVNPLLPGTPGYRRR